MGVAQITIIFEEDKVHDLMLYDTQLTIRQIVEEIRLSYHVTFLKMTVELDSTKIICKTMEI